MPDNAHPRCETRDLHDGLPRCIIPTVPMAVRSVAPRCRLRRGALIIVALLVHGGIMALPSSNPPPDDAGHLTIEVVQAPATPPPVPLVEPTPAEPPEPAASQTATEPPSPQAQPEANPPVIEPHDPQPPAADAAPSPATAAEPSSATEQPAQPEAAPATEPPVAPVVAPAEAANSVVVSPSKPPRRIAQHRPALLMAPAPLPAATSTAAASVAPGSASAQEQQLVQETFVSRIRSAVQAAAQCPAAARMMNQSGRAGVAFDYRDGRIVGDLRVVRTSGMPVLDSAALSAVRNAHYPQAPSEVLNQVLHLLVWVEEACGG